MEFEDDFEDDFEPWNDDVKGIDDFTDEENNSKPNNNAGGFFLTETEAKPFQPKQESDFDDDFVSDSEEKPQEEEEEKWESEHEKEKSESESETEPIPMEVPEVREKVVELPLEEKEKSEFESDFTDSESDNDDIISNPPSPREIVPVRSEEEVALCELSRDLLSKMTSLIMFGSTKIGATITEDDRNLKLTFESLQNKFELYVSAMMPKKSPQAERMRKLLNQNKQLKAQIKEILQDNLNLKHRLRDIDRAFNAPKKTTSQNDVRAATAALKQAIMKIQNSHKEVRDIQNENVALRNKIAQLAKNDAKKVGAEISEMRERNVAAEIEFNELQRRRKAALMKQQSQNQQLADHVNHLMMRAQDMEKRVRMLPRPGMRRMRRPF